MVRSYYTDGTSALDFCPRGASCKSNVVSFERRANAVSPSRYEAICQRVFCGEPCAHEFYSFEGVSDSKTDKVKSLLAVGIPALAMFLAIVVPALL